MAETEPTVSQEDQNFQAPVTGPGGVTQPDTDTDARAKLDQLRSASPEDQETILRRADGFLYNKDTGKNPDQIDYSRRTITLDAKIKELVTRQYGPDKAWNIAIEGTWKDDVLDKATPGNIRKYENVLRYDRAISIKNEAVSLIREREVAADNSRKNEIETRLNQLYCEIIDLTYEDSNTIAVEYETRRVLVKDDQTQQKVQKTVTGKATDIRIETPSETPKDDAEARIGIRGRAVKKLPLTAQDKLESGQLKKSEDWLKNVKENEISGRYRTGIEKPIVEGPKKENRVGDPALVAALQGKIAILKATDPNILANHGIEISESAGKKGEKELTLTIKRANGTYQMLTIFDDGYKYPQANYTTYGGKRYEQATLKKGEGDNITALVKNQSVRFTTMFRSAVQVDQNTGEESINHQKLHPTRVVVNPSATDPKLNLVEILDNLIGGL